MEKFLERYHSKITEVLSTFDRMIFKGHILPFFQKSQRHWYLFQEKVLFKDFKNYAQKTSERVKEHMEEIARKETRPVIYLDSSRISKEDIARKAQEKDTITALFRLTM